MGGRRNERAEARDSEGRRISFQSSGSSDSRTSSGTDIVDNYETDKDYYRPEIPDEVKVTCCDRFSDWACGGCKCLGCNRPISWIMLIGAVLILGAYAILSAWFISAFASINWGGALYRVKQLKKNGESQNSNAMWWVVKANGDFVQSGTSQFNYESSDTAGSTLYLTESCAYKAQCSDVYSESVCDPTGICVANVHQYVYGKDGTTAGITTTSSFRMSTNNMSTAVFSLEESRLEVDDAVEIGKVLAVEAPQPASSGEVLTNMQVNYLENNLHNSEDVLFNGNAIVMSDVDQITAGGQHYKMSSSLRKSSTAVSQKHIALPQRVPSAFRTQNYGYATPPNFNNLDQELQISSFVQVGEQTTVDKKSSSASAFQKNNEAAAVTRGQLDAILASHVDTTRIRDGMYTDGAKYYLSVAMLFGKNGAEANATAMTNLCGSKHGAIGLHEELSKLFVYIPDGLSNYGPNAYCAESSSIELISWDEDDLLGGYLMMEFKSHSDSAWTGGSDTSFSNCLGQVGKTATYPQGQMYWKMDFYCAEPLSWYMVTDVVLNDLINIFLAIVLLWYEIIEFCVGKRKVWYERFAIQCLRVALYFLVGGQLLGDLNQYWVTIGYWALAGFTVLWIFMHCFFCFAWLKIEDDDEPMFGLITHWFDDEAQEGARVERDSDGKFKLIMSDEKKEQLRKARKERGEGSDSSSATGDNSDSSSSDDSPRAGSSAANPKDN